MNHSLPSQSASSATQFLAIQTYLDVGVEASTWGWQGKSEIGGGTDPGSTTVGTGSNVVARLCLGGC